jgi:hypothetical protein
MFPINPPSIPGYRTTTPATEEQPNTGSGAQAEATAAPVDLQRPYCYALERTDVDPPRLLSWGGWESAPGPMHTAHHAAIYEAARVRVDHAYYGPMTVRVWQQRPHEHYRQPPPPDAYTLHLGDQTNTISDTEGGKFRSCADCRTPITCEESGEDRCP